MAETRSGLSLFIVEDNEAWSTIVKNKLQLGSVKEICVSGEECVAKLANFKPDIIVLDYHLEGEMTGLDTLKKIKEIHPACQVIMLSSQESVQTAVDILSNGAYDYIVKGDQSIPRLNHLVRRIRDDMDMRSEMVELQIRMKRWQAALYGVIALIFVISVLIYFNTCPNSRMISWDPFNVGATEKCNHMNATPPANPQ
ncbi:MAG: response regulator [Bacteroidia bacterium]|nr:response regulator [Bacteroidia bacterium]